MRGPGPLVRRGDGQNRFRRERQQQSTGRCTSEKFGGHVDLALQVDVSTPVYSLWARLCDDVDDLRPGVATFIETYNNEWLIERLGHRTPREAFNEATAQVAA